MVIMSARSSAISRKHSNVEFDLMQEMLGSTPRVLAAFATHVHLLVSKSPIVHQRMVLPQVSIFEISISLPLLKYVARDISIRSIARLSSCIILFKTISQSFSLCPNGNDEFSHFNKSFLRGFAISLKNKKIFEQNNQIDN